MKNTKIKEILLDKNSICEENEIKDLTLNSENIKRLLCKSTDIIYRKIKVNKKVSFCLVFIDGLADQQYISDYILKPLTTESKLANTKSEEHLIELIEQGAIYFASQTIEKDISKVIKELLIGNTALVFDNENIAIMYDTKGFDKRGISIPTEETNLKGSKDVFVETIRVNTATVRRKLRTPNLVIEDMVLGERSNTIVSLFYIDGLAEKELINEAKNRLKTIDTDEVLFTSIIEENIIDNKHSPFPQIDYTEKPDKFCAGLLEGRIGIIIDGIPFSMIIPTAIVNFFQTTDDYSYNYIISSMIRVLRYVLTATSLFLPAFYVSVTTFHPEMIPESLAFSIVASEEGVPLPIFIECFIMIIAFQTLIEAGARIWSSIGGMVSLVGALVVGEAAISASYLSPGVVVVVAVASIANFTIPNKDFAFAIWTWEFILLMLSSILGLFGLAIGGILLLYHLCQMESLGVPYLSPFVSNDGKHLYDSIFRTIFVLEKKKPISKQNKLN